MSPAPKEAGGASLVQRAMEAVNAHIHAEKLRVGDTLPGEAHFAAQLGVSRAVMREAFRSLAALKRIEVLNGRKPRVAAADASLLASTIDHALYTAQITVAEVWEVRRSIELRTVELAARYRTAAQAEVIVALAERIIAAALGLKPRLLWPDRYDEHGLPIRGWTHQASGAEKSLAHGARRAQGARE